MMHLTYAARRVRNLADGHLPVSHGEVGKIVYQDRTWIGLRCLCLGVARRLGDESQSGGESIATGLHNI